MSAYFEPAILEIESGGGLVRREALQPQLRVSMPESFLDRPKQAGTKALSVEVVIDHHQINQVIPAYRIADGLPVSDDYRAAIHVLCDVSIGCPAAEKGINRFVSQDGAIARADRRVGAVGQCGNVGRHGFADQRGHTQDWVLTIRVPLLEQVQMHHYRALLTGQSTSVRQSLGSGCSAGSVMYSSHGAPADCRPCDSIQTSSAAYASDRVS